MIEGQYDTRQNVSHKLDWSSTSTAYKEAAAAKRSRISELYLNSSKNSSFFVYHNYNLSFYMNKTF